MTVLSSRLIGFEPGFQIPGLYVQVERCTSIRSVLIVVYAYRDDSMLISNVMFGYIIRDRRQGEP